MNDLEWDNPFSTTDSDNAGFLQKFQNMLDVNLNSDQQKLLFKNVMRYSLASAVESLNRFAVSLQGGSKYMKVIEFVSGVIRDLHETGRRDAQGTGDRPAWHAHGMPVRCKRGRGYDYGWLIQEGEAYTVVVFRRNQVSGLWNHLYAHPSQAEHVEDGPLMPQARQPLVVRKVLALHPVPEFKVGLKDGAWTVRMFEVARAWYRRVMEVLIREPGDPVRHYVGYHRYREEVRLGHPVEPRGWEDMIEPKPKPQPETVPF